MKCQSPRLDNTSKAGDEVTVNARAGEWAARSGMVFSRSESSDPQSKSEQAASLGAKLTYRVAEESSPRSSSLHSGGRLSFTNDLSSFCLRRFSTRTLDGFIVLISVDDTRSCTSQFS